LFCKSEIAQKPLHRRNAQKALAHFGKLSFSVLDNNIHRERLLQNTHTINSVHETKSAPSSSPKEKYPFVRHRFHKSAFRDLWVLRETCPLAAATHLSPQPFLAHLDKCLWPNNNFVLSYLSQRWRELDGKGD